MIRTAFTRLLSNNRSVISSSSCFFQKSSFQSNTNFGLFTIPLDNLYWLKDLTRRNNSTNVTNTQFDKDKIKQAVSNNSTDGRVKEPTNTTTSKSSPLPKIYTRTGDRGTSALLGTGPNRFSKDSLIFDVLGTIDELSSTLGIVRSMCSSPSLAKELENIQCSLLEIGSCVAANNRSSRFAFNNSTLVKHLEEQIDLMTNELPELRNFILPGGSSQTGSYLHFARAVCRRCERLVTKWLNEQSDKEQQQDTVMGIYVNRLSDYLFTLARYVTYKEGHQDIIYHKSK